MGMSRYKKLVVNSSVFAVANIGSKLLKFVLVSFYTFYLTTADYGTVDTLQSTAKLTLPLIMLAIDSAALRYALKPELDRTAILTNCFAVFACSSILALLSYFIFNKITLFEGLWGLFYWLMLSEAIFSILQNFVRGIGKTYTFAISGLVNAVSMIALGIVCLAFFHLGSKGYLLSIVLSNVVGILFLFIAADIRQYLDITTANLSLIKQMLKYSIPLIPTAMMWWVINASDRYIITWLLGVSATGIYAISHKIPTIITMLYQIFQQAWQISAIEENNRESSSKAAFYSTVYNTFFKLLFIAASAIILVIKPCMRLLVSESYRDAWEYAPFLVISAVFSSLAGFLGINYIVSEKTVGALITSAICALCNIVLNIILTQLIGMQGTALATLISFYLLWLIRAKHTKAPASHEHSYLLIHLNLLLVSFQSVVLLSQIEYQFLLQAICFLTILALNYKEIKKASAMLIEFVIRTIKKV